MAANYSGTNEDLRGEKFSHSTVQVEISGLVSIALEAVTLCANIFPALTVFLLKKARERSVTDCFIGALAVNDITSVAIPLGVGIPTLLNRRWLGGGLSCKLYQISSFWFQLNGMILVTIMSCDRYFALMKPILYRREIQKKSWRVKRAVFVMFFITLAISSLPAAGLANTNIRSPLTYCPCLLITRPQLAKERVFPILYVSLGYSTFLIVSACNYSVLKVLKSFKLRFRPRKLSIESQKFSRSSLVAFTKLIMVLGVLFYLTWMPVMVVLTMNQFGVEFDETTAVYALVSLTINSLIHPFAYGAFSKQFRRGYMSILTAFCLFVACRQEPSSADCCKWSRADFKSCKRALKCGLLVMERETAL